MGKLKAGVVGKQLTSNPTTMFHYDGKEEKLVEGAETYNLDRKFDLECMKCKYKFFGDVPCPKCGFGHAKLTED